MLIWQQYGDKACENRFSQFLFPGANLHAQSLHNYILPEHFWLMIAQHDSSDIYNFQL